MEGKFRDNFTRNVEKTANDAIKNGKTVDCADVALTALVDTAQEMGLKLTFENYNSSKRGYETISSSDSKFKNKEEFLSYVKINMGAVTLLDPRTTRDTSTLTRGDLVMFDLRSFKNPSYSGHTIIVTGIYDAEKKIVNTVQGHISGTPTKEIYVIGSTVDDIKPQYKKFRFDRLFR